MWKSIGYIGIGGVLGNEMEAERFFIHFFRISIWNCANPWRQVPSNHLSSNNTGLGLLSVES